MEYDIRAYGGSKRGRSHEVTGKPCQDSSHFGLHPLFPNIALLIVADGVGSAEHSEEGSRIAVDVVKEYLESCSLPITPETMREAYQNAWDAIDKHTEEGTGWPCDYDTTLSVAVFDAEFGKVVYGHSGDGAILAIGLDGIVRSLTTPQKGAEANSVKPLRDIFSWDFGEYEGPFVSVMAMTDGVLDLLMPGRLKLTDEPIYIRLVSWLADFKFFEKKSTPIEECFAKRLSYIQSDIHKGITNDDLTFVAAMNIHVTSEYRGDEYYKEPDWAALNEQWKRMAYPSLYGGSDTGSTEEKGSIPEEAKAEDIKVIEPPKGQRDYDKAILMAASDRIYLARIHILKAFEAGHPDAIAYLDPKTLGSLDDPWERTRCKVMIAAGIDTAYQNASEYCRSKGEYVKAKEYADRAKAAFNKLAGRLDIVSSRGRPR